MVSLSRPGNLACQPDDGNVVYIGCSDDQVKIRGHRIEPGEIASILCTHPALARKRGMMLPAPHT
jgi:non-ribosomal peptide synthetase component F